MTVQKMRKIRTRVKNSCTVVKTVDVYNFSTECWSTPKALELPKVLRSPQVVVFQEYVYLMGGATTFPASPEEGEEQYNLQAWIACWSNAIEAVYEAAAAIKQKGHTSEAAGLQCSMTAGEERVDINSSPHAVRPTVISSFPSVV